MRGIGTTTRHLDTWMWLCPIKPKAQVYVSVQLTTYRNPRRVDNEFDLALPITNTRHWTTAQESVPSKDRMTTQYQTCNPGTHTGSQLSHDAHHGCGPSPIDYQLHQTYLGSALSWETGWSRAYHNGCSEQYGHRSHRADDADASAQMLAWHTYLYTRHLCSLISTPLGVGHCHPKTKPTPARPDLNMLQLVMSSCGCAPPRHTVQHAAETLCEPFHGAACMPEHTCPYNHDAAKPQP